MEYLKLLIVDDEDGIRTGVERILKNYCLKYPFLDYDIYFNVLKAPTGEDGIELIKTEKPDIVLLDNKLPGIQGTEVLEFIKSSNLDCRVAIITSFPSLQIAVKTTYDGAADFIPKPFTPEELRSSLNTIVKQLLLSRITKKLSKEGKEVRFQFLSVLSHELKSPINAIIGYLRLMQEKQFGNDIEAYAEMIERSILRADGMKTLIMDLLDLTKIKLSRQKSELQNLSINDIAQNAVDLIRPYAIQKDISIKMEGSIDFEIEANKEDIEIIFNNLLSNAVKYNVDGGSVNVKLGYNENDIKIEVEDSGIGMSEEEAKKLFNDFVRIKNERTKNIVGSGLGLSIIKKLLKIYGGEITVESEVNKGTKFIITIPRK